MTSSGDGKAGRLFIISAPSGTGKSTVISRLLEMRPELVFSVSATTRDPRDDETDGTAYNFVTREEFEQMIADGEFLEYAEYVGNYYGTPKKPIYDSIAAGRDNVLEIDVQGAAQIMAIMPDAVTIFIAPPNRAELERRLRSRGTDTEERLSGRLLRAEAELSQMHMYKYIVVNDDIDRAAREILSIIDSEPSPRQDAR